MTELHTPFIRTMGRYTLVFLSLWLIGCTQPKGRAESDAEGQRFREVPPQSSTKSTDLRMCEAQNSHTLAHLRRVQFVDEQCGWVVGDHGTVLHTRDGGRSWVQSTIATNYDLVDARFIDCSVGWVVGIDQILSPSRSRLWHTNDGGLTWLESRLGITEAMRGMEFSGPEHGWLFGRGSIRHDEYLEEYGVVGRSTDGGRSWGFANLPSGPIDKDGPVLGLSFPDPRHGWAIGSEVIRDSTDGGATWQLQYKKEYNPTNLYGFQYIHFINDTTGWVSGYEDGDSGYFTGILRTIDGGRTWKESHATHPLITIRFLDGHVGIGVGAAIPAGYLSNPGGGPMRDGILMLTTDSGDTWREIYRTNDCRLLDVFVNDSGQCWAVGERGAIIHGLLRHGSSN